jgi:short-subunit dehydrogenase
MSFFKNKVVVITGGSDGIGKALVEMFLHHGAKVATCGRSNDKLYDLEKSHPDESLITYSIDVSSETDCSYFIEQVIKIFGSIDVLINNAGISMRALFNETNLDTLKKVMDINFWGTVYCTKYALPYILKQQGTVVGVSSIAGYRGLPGRTGYCASKFAMNGFFEALRTELLESGVNIMWVCPGFTASNIRNAALNKNAKPQGVSPMDENKMMTAEECATLILQAIEKRKRTLIFSANDKRTVLVNRLMPSLADKLTRKFFFKNGELVK